MSKRRYGKLVRDNIPELIRSDGDMPNYRVMQDDEFRKELLYKLIEESEELRKAGEYASADKEALLAESADVLEVLYAIFNEFGLDANAVEEVRIKKGKELSLIHI